MVLHHGVSNFYLETNGIILMGLRIIQGVTPWCVTGKPLGIWSVKPNGSSAIHIVQIWLSHLKKLKFFTQIPKKSQVIALTFLASKKFPP